MTKQQLRDYCDAEFENIALVLSELNHVREQGHSAYITADLAAIATFIHNTYNGIENIQKRLFSYLNIEIQDTPTWHKDALKTSLDKRIISADLYNTLSDYLSFRHFFVHSYSFNLRWEELKPQMKLKRQWHPFDRLFSRTSKGWIKAYRV